MDVCGQLDVPSAIPPEEDLPVLIRNVVVVIVILVEDFRERGP
jgi:hypothetical protein